MIRNKSKILVSKLKRKSFYKIFNDLHIKTEKGTFFRAASYKLAYGFRFVPNRLFIIFFKELELRRIDSIRNPSSNCLLPVFSIFSLCEFVFPQSPYVIVSLLPEIGHQQQRCAENLLV